MLAQLQQKYPDELKIVYRHFPLSSHDKAPLAAQAAEAAGKQDQFWQMHDLLFKERADWISLTPEEFQKWLEQQVTDLGLDLEKFNQDLNSPELVKLVKDAYEKNVAIGMPGTPFLVINGEPYNGPLDFANLDATVGLMLLAERQFSECPPMILEKGKQYFAVVHTER